METTKKTLLILLGILLVAGSIYGGFYLFKKILNQKEKKSEVVFLPEQPTLNIKRDLEGDIPAVFPEKLIPKEDISLTLESFSVPQGNKTQYTYRYVSKKDFIQNKNYFINFFTSNKDFSSLSNTRTVSNNFFFSAYRSKKDNTEIMVTINLYQLGYIVDITIIK